MSETLEAIYENGVFKPLKAPRISEGQHVRLTIETASEATPEELLNLAAKVYQGLSDKQIHEIEAIALNRSDFFRRKAL
jgi:predicted DNA-binding antitoxin AbrB/MazE fold protein